MLQQQRNFIYLVFFHSIRYLENVSDSLYGHVFYPRGQILQHENWVKDLVSWKQKIKIAIDSHILIINYVNSIDTMGNEMCIRCHYQCWRMHELERESLRNKLRKKIKIILNNSPISIWFQHYWFANRIFKSVQSINSKSCSFGCVIFQPHFLSSMRNL